MSDSVAGLIRRAARQLSLRGIETAALDARLLLQSAAGMTHAEIVAEPDLILAPEVVAKFWLLMERRSAFEPVSRILGTREFYGREFQVKPAVLDPRADTEVLIEAALTLGREKSLFRILDLGTGSGAIVVTLLSELPNAAGVATDVSKAALAVAKSNAEMLGVSGRLRFVQAHWFEGLNGQFDLIISNPPYIPAEDIAGLLPDVRDFDPLGALDGGADGLAAYRMIAAGAAGYLAPQGHILMEIGAGQEIHVQRLFEALGFTLDRQYTDLAGHVRCLGFNLPR
jgi:release factor glutamine methyltransferase